MRFKTLRGSPKGKAQRGQNLLLQMVLEPDIGQYVNEDTKSQGGGLWDLKSVGEGNEIFLGCGNFPLVDAF